MSPATDSTAVVVGRAVSDIVDLVGEGHHQVLPVPRGVSPAK